LRLQNYFCVYKIILLVGANIYLLNRQIIIFLVPIEPRAKNRDKRAKKIWR